MTDVSAVRTASIIRAIIALMMEAARISETSVNFNITTWRYIQEDSKFHTRRRGNLKSHNSLLVSRSLFRVPLNLLFLFIT
jgi:hypothetical protein